jgi:hypothetical protein
LCWLHSAGQNHYHEPLLISQGYHSEFISLIWKEPHYDKSQEGMPGLQEDFAKSTAQQKSDPEFIIRTA